MATFDIKCDLFYNQYNFKKLVDSPKFSCIIYVYFLIVFCYVCVIIHACNFIAPSSHQLPMDEEVPLVKAFQRLHLYPCVHDP